MPENVNTSHLLDSLSNSIEDNRQTAIEVDGVSMVFNMASEQLNSLKEYAIALARRELLFKEFRALDNVSFEVKKGDVFGILGTNGSGKSTMLKIVAGVLEPTEGRCEIHGNIAPLIELGAGFDLELTARENIYLNGALLGYSRKFLEQHFNEIVEFAEIESFLDMPLKNYSSGMVARIAFAIATVIVPDILIVDEVLSVGDFMFQQKCENRITDLIKEHGVTVLIVSHNNDQIERLCNKAIWIEKGHTRLLGSASEVCEAYRVLGGRTGSLESEQKIFSLLYEPAKIADDAYTTIAGDDRYSSAVKLTEKAYAPPASTAIVVSGETTSPSMIATSLSGLLETPVFLTSSESFPDISAQALKRYSPNRIIILGEEHVIPSSVVNEIYEACKPGTEIVRIKANTLPSLACEAYRYGKNEQSWSTTAAIAYADCLGELVSVAPYLHTERIPLFFIDDMEANKVASVLSNGAFSEFILLGGKERMPKQIAKTLSQKSVPIVELKGENPYHANTLVNKWIKERGWGKNSISSDNVIVCSAINPFDAFAGSTYAGKTESLFLLEDPSDLDSVAKTIDYLLDDSNHITHLTFLGSNIRFTKTDKLLLSKAIALKGRKLY